MVEGVPDVCGFTENFGDTKSNHALPILISISSASVDLLSDSSDVELDLPFLHEVDS